MTGLRNDGVRNLLEWGEWMGEMSGEGDDFAIYGAWGEDTTDGEGEKSAKGWVNNLRGGGE